MDDRQKQILTLEKDSSRLVDELVALKREVSSYKAATDELDKARNVLAGFLEQTQKLTQQTHKLLEAVNAIGSAKIFEQLEVIQIALVQNAKKEAKRNLLLVIGLILVVVLQVAMLVMLKSGR
jgi:seryl-tRNA synthetase